MAASVHICMSVYVCVSVSGASFPKSKWVRGGARRTPETIDIFAL